MSSYTESDFENDIKAYTFFSKENTTRINIAQQKMSAWKKKMKESVALIKQTVISSPDKTSPTSLTKHESDKAFIMQERKMIKVDISPLRASTLEIVDDHHNIPSQTSKKQKKNR